MKSPANGTGQLRRTLPRMPTVEETNLVLLLWRSDELRKKAWQMLESGTAVPVFLRTYYDPEEDEKMEEWVSASEEFENQAWWASLNDATLFNFGSDWQHVYEIMPAVAGPVSGAGYKRYPSSEINEPDLWREDPYGLIEVEGADLLRIATVAYILVADQTAFEIGYVRLVYVDGRRNVIWGTPVDAQTITDVIMDWDQLNLPLEFWEEGKGTIGERYRVTGDLGRELYQLSEADMTDP
ncbi:hypothetical protein PENDEC_c002G01583 [Penicillium decumbens]|uniref:Uncharacterized protein n=1 Tax=Penicillium decumbens TaxID=69771 RepID=A0A1V6PL03_PENDC|nr:hypothetical protein PENDEC_c002G01583 [Penicillium decumbens]